MRLRSSLPLATGIVALPLLVALVALRSRHWYPVLDLAMTELRVRDVFGAHTPLIGLPGRIGEYPDQGSHPGPLSFYLLAPVYRLAGSTAWALQAATVVIHVAVIATALWIGHRRAATRGVIAVAALLAVVVRGYGGLLLTQPWNPYLPLLAWVVVLLAAWAVACGDSAVLVPMVVAATLCAQTHVPYLVPAGVLTVGTLILVFARGDRRRAVIAAAVGVVLWIPPMVDQIVNDPGNVAKLLDHFGSPPEPALGLVDGAALALRHLDPWSGFAGQLAGSGRFVSPAATWRGALMLGLWVAAAVVAWRIGSRALRALHVVVATALALGFLSMVRIFGRPWFYLTLWAWGVAALALGAVTWTALSLYRHTAADPARAARATAGAVTALGALALTATTASAVAFASVPVPEPRLSDAVGALAGPAYDAVVAGVGAASGPDGAYLVRWSDAADIGSPGFGLFSELERRGLDVWGDEYFHTPLTDHRVRPHSDDLVQIHLATGGYVDLWRQAPGAVEVATYDPRDSASIVAYHATRNRVVARLHDEGLDDVAAMIDTNLFGASLQPRLSAADRADITTLLDLGQPMAVFIAPASVDPLRLS